MRRSCACFCCWSGSRSITGGFAARLRLLRRLEQEITLSTEQLPEPDGALEAQYQALVRALDADRRAQMTRSQRSYQDLVEYYTVWAHQIKTPIAAMRLLLQDADTDEQRALLEQLQSVEQYVEMVLGYLRLESPSSDYVIRNYALDDIVRQAVRKFASQFIRRKLRLEYTPLNVSVVTDEKWLLFVIEQVLSNALKYSAQRLGLHHARSAEDAVHPRHGHRHRARGSAARV
ncbi:MAG: sensor histidine kinase [Oscillospiraceae bacterium]